MVLSAYKAVIRKDKKEILKRALEQRKPQIIQDFYNTDRIMTMSVFLFGNTLYCYIESVNETVLPEDLFGVAAQNLIPLPDLEERVFRPMTEIFHFNMPQSAEHWKRKQKPDFCFGMLARLIPSMTARYIFYHYQLQEEQPGKWDKYSRIFLSDDIAFFYGEIPEVFEPAPYQGALSTHNTPPDKDWQRIMEENFIPWDSSLPKCDENYNWQKEGYPEGKLNNQWLYAEHIFSVI